MGWVEIKKWWSAGNDKKAIEPIKVSVEIIDFESLINGKALTKQCLTILGVMQVDVLLKDIGYDKMIEIIEKAKNSNH